MIRIAFPEDPRAARTTDGGLAASRPQLSATRTQADTRYAMIQDLRNILDGWEYEPGKISVRKIIGCDGREKIQTRVDLGLLQLEPEGRPDGRRPYGCDSMLTFFEMRLQEYVAKNGSDEGFVLLAEDCRDLRHETHLNYQRYLSLFVLEEYDGVERDTERNLRLIELCRRYAETEYDRDALESQWPYVMMMYTRAKVYQAMQSCRYETALVLLERGTAKLLEWEADEEKSESESVTAELEVLESLRQEVLEQMPAGAVPRLRWELNDALAREDFERAAALRDKLSALRRDEDAV
jgi:hypothetical protein